MQLLEFSNLEVCRHGIKLIKLRAKTGCLAIPNPLTQEIVAVGVLSISAYRTPSLLSEASYYGKKAYAGPAVFGYHLCCGFLFFLLYIKAIRLVSWLREASLIRAGASENAF